MITIQNTNRVVCINTANLMSWDLSVQEDRVVLCTKPYQEKEQEWCFLYESSIRLSENQKIWLADSLSTRMISSTSVEPGTSLYVDFKRLLKECQQKS